MPTFAEVITETLGAVFMTQSIAGVMFSVIFNF